jgi:hypothetical protein
MKNQKIQFKRTTPLIRIVGSLLCTLLVSLAALTARAQTDTVIDPQGDAFYTPGLAAPAFLDILAASITISDTITLTVDVAGSLDALPDPSGGYFDWHFPLNTDNSTDPPGFPLPPNQTAPAEFGVDADWDGTAFSGLLYDRRPALTGQPALLYSIPVSVSGSRITLTVPEALAAQVRASVVLPGATWNCTTLWVSGNHGLHGADDIGGRRPWPQ